MKTSHLEPPTPDRALFSADGQTWADSPGSGPVRKIVIGTPPRKGEEAKPVKWSSAVARDLEAHLPGLTHLHLWQIESLKEIAGWSEGLEWLDLRGCPNLGSLPPLPGGLESLVIEDCPALTALALPDGGFPVLRDLSLRGCAGLPESAIHALLAAAPVLERFDASGCPQLARVPAWPGALARIDLNECANLIELPPWPPAIRRAGLRGAGNLRAVPDFPPPSAGAEGRGIDYLDLAGTKALRELPEGIDGLRTLFLHGSGVELPPTLFGENDESNVAEAVRAYLAEAGRGTVADHEVKVILLGNGRCGKSSLVRRLVEGTFDPEERSTHGIRLRTLELDFQPIDESRPARATLNLWDFAGQDLYHNTHRTFLQSKAVYVLCVTDHGHGADPAGDRRPDPEMESGDDVRRSLRYWREQVAALGPAPGMDEPPPILLVRMKADRDGEPGAPPPWRNCEAGADLDRHSLSARTGAGFPEFREALARAAATVLGPKKRRSLGKRPMRVKDALRPWKAANEEAFREGERLQRRVPSPHPTLSRADFDTLVRQHCPGSDYDRDPGLLLEQFHLSGFLSYDAKYLPDTVILDQPWAFEAIYTVMHRGRCHPRLKEKGGRFTPADLARWAWSADDWNPAGYTADEQATFLRFMESHRVAAKLFEAGERDDGQPVYLAPYYLPPWENARMRVEASETAAGPPVARAVIVSRYLGRDVAQGLLIELVRRFSRSAEVWKWGAHFRAYEVDAAVTLDWRASDDLELFGGQIEARYRGAGAEQMHAYLVARLRELAAYPQDAEVVFEWLAVVPPQPAPVPVEAKPLPETEALFEARHGMGDAAIGAGIQAPTREATVGAKVAISYAGSNPKSDIPAERHLGALPQALTAYLKTVKHIPVLEYSDQYRESHLPRFIEDLVRQDYLVIFLSEKYFKSPYCMWELMLLYDEPPERVFPPGRALFLALPGVPLYQDRDAMLFRTQWEDHWTQWCAERKEDAKMAAQGDPDRYQKLLHSMGQAAWFDFVSQESLREGLIGAVFQNCFNQVVADPAVFEPGTPAFEALTRRHGDDVAAALEKPEIVFRMAARLWQQAGHESGAERKATKERAKVFYLRARRLSPGYDAATDGRKMAKEAHQENEPAVEDLLNELRRDCVADLVAAQMS